MGQVYEAITPRLRAFIEAQQVFFVATAPPSPDGHVNLSPKGVGGTFAVVDERTVAYLDITASGAETIAHARADGRITVMFCSFDRTPKILRLHGRVRVVGRYDEDFDPWRSRFPTPVADSFTIRAVVVVDVERVADSCGYGLPLLEPVGEREMLVEHMERKGADGVRDYRLEKNRLSIDGLPAFDDDPLPSAASADGPGA